MSEHGGKRKFLVLAVAAVVVVGVAAVVLKMRAVDVEASAAVDDIEARLDDLDPITRAATLEKLAKDGV
ncbi:MAG: hypothetical protein QG597_2414 [Actinomycetota bacterium]|nr:hypothetical protein [Actinomycetota bacterium]